MENRMSSDQHASTRPAAGTTSTGRLQTIAFVAFTLACVAAVLFLPAVP
jgi:hypothetical protein